MNEYLDDDYCGCEPNEFQVQIDELVHGEVSRRIEQTVKDIEEYREKYTQLQKKLYATEKELRKQKNDADNNLKQAVKEKELETQRALGFGFAVNDTVFYVGSDCKTEKCKQCVGKGTVVANVLGKDAKVSCPHCSYGTIRHYTYYPKKSTAESMNFWVTKVDSWSKAVPGVVKENNVKIYIDGREGEMRPSSLYKTLEECQAVCDEKNSQQVSE